MESKETKRHAAKYLEHLKYEPLGDWCISFTGAVPCLLPVRMCNPQHTATDAKHNSEKGLGLFSTNLPAVTRTYHKVDIVVLILEILH